MLQLWSTVAWDMDFPTPNLGNTAAMPGMLTPCLTSALGEVHYRNIRRQSISPPRTTVGELKCDTTSPALHTGAAVVPTSVGEGAHVKRDPYMSCRREAFGFRAGFTRCTHSVRHNLQCVVR